MKKRILNLSRYDYAGAAHRYSEAVNRVGRYESTSVRFYPHRFIYESDYTIFHSWFSDGQYKDTLASIVRPLESIWSKIPAALALRSDIKKRVNYVQELINEADIIHVVGDFPIFHYCEHDFDENIYLKNLLEKPIIVTPVGSLFRRHLKKSPISLATWSMEEHKRHTSARTVDTPDLNYPEFDAEWLPFTLDTTPIENSWLNHTHDVPLIGHSPSSRNKKGTDSVFLPALEILKSRGIKFELDIIENTSYTDSLERKKNLSLFFDQSGFGWYGCSLIEATQHGIPSLAWISEHSLNQMNPEDRDVPVVSFVPTAEGCADAIINILESDMEALSRKTKKWTDDVHSYEAVGTKLSNIYDRMLSKSNRKKSSGPKIHKVSVIMNTWNENPQWLKEAVESYLQQKNVTIQLIISTVAGDPSLTLLKNYPQIEFCINEKPNIYSQLNKACELVRYPWLAYAASDDVALSTKLFDEIHMCLDNNKKICSSAFHKTDEKLNIMSTYKVPENYSMVDNLRGNCVSDCALLRTDILKEYGPFDMEMDNMAHWDFWLRVSTIDPDVFIFNKEATWLYRQHPNARHTKRQGQVNKIKKREAARKRMMQKHYHLLEKHHVEHLVSLDIYK